MHLIKEFRSYALKIGFVKLSLTWLIEKRKTIYEKQVHLENSFKYFH